MKECAPNSLLCYYTENNVSERAEAVVRIFFFSIWVFFHEYSRITGLQMKGEGIPLTPQYQFQPLHRQLDITWANTAESSPVHIGSNLNQPGKPLVSEH